MMCYLMEKKFDETFIHLDATASVTGGHLMTVMRSIMVQKYSTNSNHF